MYWVYFHFFFFENRQFAFLPSGYSYYTNFYGYCVSRLCKEKCCFTNDFVNFLTWIKGSVIIDFSTEHNLTSIYRYFIFIFWASSLNIDFCVYMVVSDIIIFLSRDKYTCTSKKVSCGNRYKSFNINELNIGINKGVRD